MKTPKKEKLAEDRSDYYWLALCLLAGMLMGVFFIFLLPPWQHYDEPKHFEHVWLAANLDHLPGPEDRDEELNRQVMASMGLYRFYGDKRIITFEPGQKVDIEGFSQLSEPPFYYLAAAVPVRLLQSSRIEIQLIAARFVSLFFYLVTILSAWGIARVLTSKNHPLRWMLPLSLVFLPAFTDLMTAVNSDAAAVAVASLFLWAAVSMLKRGFSWIALIGLVSTCVLAYFTKNTAYFVILLFPFMLLFSLAPTRWRAIAWVIVFAAAATGFWFSLVWDEPVDWLRASLQSDGLRELSNKAVDGDYAFRMDTGAAVTPEWWPPILQSIPMDISTALTGKTLTLGFWAWSEKPNMIQSPSIQTVDKTFSIQIEVEKNPKFFAFEIQVPDQADRAWVALQPQPFKEGATIFFDGLVLAVGQRPLNQEPIFQDEGGRSGTWGESSFENILRNASAESISFRFRPQIDAIGARFLPDNTLPSMILGALVDLQGTQHVHATAFERLFRHFWGQFAWGHIALAGWKWVGRPYFWLGLFTLVGVSGALLAIVRRARQLNWSLVFVLLIALGFVWGLTFLRGVPYLTQKTMYLSVARHAYPVIIPTMLVFSAGWYEIILYLERICLSIYKKASRPPAGSATGKCRWFKMVMSGLYIACLILLTTGAVVSIAQYYRLI